jgi:Skp family chaperone for outer membrane proteins
VRKGFQTPKLDGQLSIEELYEKRQAELAKIKPNGERTVRQFGTILVGDARLKVIAQNEAEERAKEALRLKKNLQRKKQEYKEGVAKRKAERIAKKAAQEAEKAAKIAELAQLIAEGGPNPPKYVGDGP